MSKINVPVVSKKASSKLVRARFGPGMLLQHDDLEQLNSYTRDLSRLLFRSLLGCGVICGLRVSVSVRCGMVEITVDAGVALECSGDPVHVPTAQTLMFDEECDADIKSPLWVVLCGTVKSCAPRGAMCADEDDVHSECTRELHGFEIRVMRDRPKCVCGCADLLDAVNPLIESECKCVNPELPCYEDHYNGNCGCHCDQCSDCDCKCVLLARLDKKDDVEQPWRPDHRVRRFIRPVLMRDPVVAEELGQKARPDESHEGATAIEEVNERLAQAAEEREQREAQKSRRKKRGS